MKRGLKDTIALTHCPDEKGTESTTGFMGLTAPMKRGLKVIDSISNPVSLTYSVSCTHCPDEKGTESSHVNLIPT